MGEYDQSIPTGLCIEILQGIVSEGGHDFTIQLKLKANHSLVDVTTGNRILYLTIPGGVVDWIKTKVAADFSD